MKTIPSTPETMPIISTDVMWFDGKGCLSSGKRKLELEKTVPSYFNPYIVVNHWKGKSWFQHPILIQSLSLPMDYYTVYMAPSSMITIPNLFIIKEHIKLHIHDILLCMWLLFFYLMSLIIYTDIVPPLDTPVES